MTQATTGIEIELPWPTMLRRVDEEAADILIEAGSFYNLTGSEKDRVQQGFDLLDEVYKRPVEAMFGDRITRGNDGFAEFALRPQRDYQELVETVDELYARGILVSGEQYPLHTTLGNVPFTPASWLILMAMELSGGTTPERITQQGTWDRKGVAGILPRQPHELTLGATQGFEMRSLAVRDIESLQTTLYIAQAAGNLLIARTRDDATAKNTWRDLYHHLMQGSRDKLINADAHWRNPCEDITPWQRVAQALTDEAWRQTIEKGVLELL